MKTRHAQHRGFTLTEVMIVVAIIAILAAFAYPQYQEHVARARRADAKASLLDTAQWMERRFTTQSTYAGLTTATLPPLRNASTATFYRVELAAGSTQTTYTLQMVPQGVMVGDRCGTFTINQAGARDITGNTAAGTVDYCWGR